jgi:hypothetical protein
MTCHRLSTKTSQSRLFFLAVYCALACTVTASGRSVADGALAGQVSDDKGAPVSCEVRVFRETVSEGRSALDQACDVTSDKAGVFSCLHLRPGRYLVRSSADNAQSADAGPGNTFAVGYYADALDLSSAARVLVASQGAQWVDVIQHQVAAHRVTGSLAARNIVGEVSFHLAEVSSSGETIEMRAATVYEPRTGRFELRTVPSGSYVLQAFWVTHDDNDLLVSTQGETAFFVGDKDLSDLRIIGRSITTLEGTVETSDGLGSSDVRSITLQDTSGVPASMTVSVEPNGRFQVPVLLDGTYAVSVVSSNAFVKDVSVSGVIGNGYDLFVLPGHPQTSAKITVGTRSAHIIGVVNPCREPAAPCGVVVKSEETGAFSTLVSDRRGMFMIGGLAPGEYRLYAWKNMTDIPYADPLFLQRFHAVRVDVGEGDTAYGIDLPPLDAQ